MPVIMWKLGETPKGHYLTSCGIDRRVHMNILSSVLACVTCNFAICHKVNETAFDH